MVERVRVQARSSVTVRLGAVNDGICEQGSDKVTARLIKGVNPGEWAITFAARRRVAL